MTEKEIPPPSGAPKEAISEDAVPDTEALKKAVGYKPGKPLWVFGYGSLIWAPCFIYEQALAAHVAGWHRDFCLYTTKYRGTVEYPGLILGLDRGGFCQGVAFEIAPDNVEDALYKLWEREMAVEDFYVPLGVPARIIGTDDTKVNALAFVVREGNPVHCPDLTPDQGAEIIANAVGMNGSNAEYLEKTVMGLQRIGIEDPKMEDLLLRMRTKKLLSKAPPPLVATT